MATKTNTPTLFADLPKTAGGAISALASMKGQLLSGAFHMVVNHPDFAEECVAAHGVAKKKKTPMRDAMLNVWRDTPEGGYFEATKRDIMLVPPKSRTEAQHGVLRVGKLTENAISIQMQRLADVTRAIGVLRSVGFHIAFDLVDNSRTWYCYIRNEKGAGELGNQRIHVDALMRLANMKSHNITEKTTAADVLAKTKGQRKAGKKKGNETNATADLVNSKTGDVLAALDTRLAALCDSDKHLIDGVSAATRANAHRVWARLERTLSDADKAAALAAFDADAAIVAAPKVKRTRKAA